MIQTVMCNQFIVITEDYIIVYDLGLPVFSRSLLSGGEVLYTYLINYTKVNRDNSRSCRLLTAIVMKLAGQS